MRNFSRLLLLALVGLLLAVRPAGAQAPQANASANAPDYRLGVGDKVRVIVYGEDELSGEFQLDATGSVSLKLIGRIEALGLTARQLEGRVADQLRAGYLKDPHVAVEVVAFRPFYILGEVQKRGSYPYVSGMSVATAVAIAGGYTYRASQRRITVERFGDPAKTQHPADETTEIYPGDIIRVPERSF